MIEFGSTIHCDPGTCKQIAEMQVQYVLHGSYLIAGMAVMYVLHDVIRGRREASHD